MKKIFEQCIIVSLRQIYSLYRKGTVSEHKMDFVLINAATQLIRTGELKSMLVIKLEMEEERRREKRLLENYSQMALP